MESDDEEEYDAATDESIEGEESGDPVDEFEQKLKDSFEGIAIKMVVTFPGEIIESNATSVDGNTATWEYSIEDMEKAENIRAVIRK
jgi:hypothetical protein